MDLMLSDSVLREASLTVSKDLSATMARATPPPWAPVDPMMTIEGMLRCVVHEKEKEAISLLDIEGADWMRQVFGYTGGVARIAKNNNEVRQCSRPNRLLRVT
jgi:hypothetical protein